MTIKIDTLKIELDDIVRIDNAYVYTADNTYAYNCSLSLLLQLEKIKIENLNNFQKLKKLQHRFIIKNNSK